MKKHLLSILILATIMVALPIQATAGGYIGINGGVIDADGADFNAVQLVAGIQANDWAGLELRYGQGIGDETINGVQVELDDYYGMYATLTLPMGESLNPYIIAGKTWGTVKASYNGYSASSKESDTSVGAGVRFAVRESFIIGVEYMQIMDDTDSLTISMIFPI